MNFSYRIPGLIFVVLAMAEQLTCDSNYLKNSLKPQHGGSESWKISQSKHEEVYPSYDGTINITLKKSDPEKLQRNSLGGHEIEQASLESNQRKVESNVFEAHTIRQLHDATATVNKVLTICSRVSALMGDYSKGLTDLMTFRIGAIKETFVKFPTVLRRLDIDESTKGLFNVDKYIKTSLSLTIDEVLFEQAEAMHRLVDNDSTELDVRYALALMTKAVSGTTRRIVERTSALEKSTSLENKL